MSNDVKLEQAAREYARRIVAEHYGYDVVEDVSDHCAEVELVLMGVKAARHQSHRDAVLEAAVTFARSESERAQKAEWSRDRALEENAANQRAKMAVVDMIASHPKYARGSAGGVRRTDKTTGHIGEYKYTPAWEKVAEFIHGLLVEMGGDADTMWAEYLKAWKKYGCDTALTTPAPAEDDDPDDHLGGKLAAAVERELDRIEQRNSTRQDFTPAFDRELARKVIMAGFGLFSCRGGTTASGHQWMELLETLGLDKARPVSPAPAVSTDEIVAVLEPFAKAAAAYLKPEQVLLEAPSREWPNFYLAARDLHAADAILSRLRGEG